MGSFLYDKEIRHERVKALFTHHTPKVCSYMSLCRISFFFFSFFFIRFFFSRISWFTGQQWKGEAISLTPLYHFQPFHRQLDISQVIAAESSPLRIAGSRPQTRNLCFPIGSRKALSYVSFKICPFYTVVRSMLKTWATLGNISLVLLNLIKRFLFPPVSTILPPMFTQLTFIFSL